jgi:hypothetical protein
MSREVTGRFEARPPLTSFSFLDPGEDDGHERDRKRDQHPVLQMDVQKRKFAGQPLENGRPPGKLF